MPDPLRLEPLLRKATRPRPDCPGALSLRTLLPLAVIALTTLSATSSQAQQAWVMDRDVNLTLRTGAGTQYRIIGSLTTGDVATILSRGDGWTKVRTEQGKEGWVSAGFLQASPPARIGHDRSRWR